MIDPDHRDLLLLYGVLTSGALAGVGIIWESREETGEPFKTIAKTCIKVGVITELAFTLLLFISEEATSRAQNNKIIELDERIIIADRHALDRSLDSNNTLELSRVANKFSGTTVAFFTFKDDVEALKFAISLADAFKDAKWIVDPNIRAVDPTVTHIIVTGVMIVGPGDDKSDEITGIIGPTLNRLGFCAGAIPRGSARPVVSSSEIEVLVGTKNRTDPKCE